MFKSYFIDFEFALNQEYVESEIGLIPRGWRVYKLSEFLPVITGRKNVNITSAKGKYPFFSCSQDFLWTNEYSFEGNAILVAGNGWAQVGAILLVTIIIRALLMLVTLPSTLSQTKMQLIQPELLKIQQKYPNSNTNQYEKQRMSQETMALYKKHKIHPFTQILVLIVQFPVFICVWGALSASSPLSTGNFYNMNLSMSNWTVLNNVNGLPGNTNGWWTAFALIIIMSICQFMATLVPTIIQKIQRKKISKLGKNPAEAKQNKTMKIVQWVMLAVIIVMGFTLPSGMGIYWIGGALFSVIQSLLVFFIGNRKKKKKVK